MKWITVLYAVLIVLMVCDVIMTKIGLSIGMTELGALALFTMYQVGFEVSSLLKMGVALLLGGLIWATRKVAKLEEENLANNIIIVVLVALIVFYTCVVLNNLYWIHIAIQG